MEDTAAATLVWGMWVVGSQSDQDSAAACWDSSAAQTSVLEECCSKAEKTYSCMGKIVFCCLRACRAAGPGWSWRGKELRERGKRTKLEQSLANGPEGEVTPAVNKGEVKQGLQHLLQQLSVPLQRLQWLPQLWVCKKPSVSAHSQSHPTVSEQHQGTITVLCTLPNLHLLPSWGSLQGQTVWDHSRSSGYWCPLQGRHRTSALLQNWPLAGSTSLHLPEGHSRESGAAAPLLTVHEVTAYIHPNKTVLIDIFLWLKWVQYWWKVFGQRWCPGKGFVTSEDKVHFLLAPLLLFSLPTPHSFSWLHLSFPSCCS